MVVVLKQKVRDEEIQALVEQLESYGVKTSIMEGVDCKVIGLLGDTSLINKEEIENNEIVEKVMRVSEPYKKANRKFHPKDSVYQIGGHTIGGKKLAIIAGPCSVESEEQIIEVARLVKKSGAHFLRGGAFKPRSSPYSFQGLGDEGLDLLLKAKAEVGLGIVSELMSIRHLERFERDVDIIQVGARNMQNFDLLKELGKIRKPILLKRGLSNTLEEWLMSAEYIMAGGNEQVILCERGIRTFETFTRNTCDISAVPAIKRLSHLPILVDPSHSAGMRFMVESLSLAAIAAGADGIIVEVHNNPTKALCDGQQSIWPDQFDEIVNKIKAIAPIVGREV